MKVLYVEDNPANVFLVKRVARMGNHEIINYIDGGQALKKYDEINPDLVLMDIQLAGDKSGLDVVRELRARGVKTTIIAVTAYAMVGDKERCIEAGCDDYLAKPLPIPRLVEIFEMHSKRVALTAPSVPSTPITPAETAKPEPVTEVPKVEAPNVENPVVEAPKVDVPNVENSVAEVPKVEPPVVEAAPIVEKLRTATAPLNDPLPELKASPASEAPAKEEVKAAETPELKTADEKKKAEESNVKPEASSN